MAGTALEQNNYPPATFPGNSTVILGATSTNTNEFLASDLFAMGIRVWLDEAEIKLGDSLIKKLGMESIKWIT